MAIEAGESSDRIALEPDESWADTDLARLDPGLYWVVSLIEAGEWEQCFWRAGMQPDVESIQNLPLLLELKWADFPAERAREWIQKLRLEVPDAYLSGKRPTHITARIPWQPGDQHALEGTSSPLRQQIADILKEPRVVRLELPAASQALNEDALGDIGLGPGSREHKGEFLDGRGVVIGIIDDGCALAHPKFLNLASGGKLESRVLSLWDQSGAGNPAAGWTKPNGYDGLEITNSALDIVIGKHTHDGVVDEDKVYGDLRYIPADLATHGTHVMDIAAGNEQSLMGTEGVAPRAHIIFVQLPAAAIASGGGALGMSIVDGVNYIFAKAGSKPTVINISYGGYFGPHDGTSFVEEAIDAALAQSNRAVVVSAGNGYEADCHAHADLARKHDRRCLRWIVKPEDPTPNDLEVWYNRDATLALFLTAPDGTALGPVALGARPHKIKIGSKVIGSITHKRTTTGSQPNLIRIYLNQTTAKATSAGSNPAPSGTWQVELENVGNVAATLDAWIERDTSGRPGGARRQQSHFHPDDADARGTLASYATGNLAVSVGAYNTATDEVCRYSACGPTRDGRNKPDVLAPAEEEAAGRGILSASSRSAQPTRMNGTSAAAPQVTGLIALLFQYATAIGKTLSATEVLDLVRTGAHNAAPYSLLRPNLHVDVDVHRKDKQGDKGVWPELIGEGKISWPETITLI
jgi:subtilisin family serine protease